MRVSVIIPTFNRAALLPRAVDSVLAQDWRPLEIIVVDDGSTDDTPAVVAQIAQRSGNVQLKTLRQPNGGDASARNAGIDASTGDWVAFLDDDDTRRPGSISAQLNALNDAQASCGLVAQGDGLKPGGARRLLSGDCAAAFLRGEQSAAITSLLVRRDVVDAVGRFDTSLPIGSDMEWIARLAHHADFAALPEVVADYTFSEQALSRFRGLDELIERDANDLRVVDLVRERCEGGPRFDSNAWLAFAARTYARCVNHRLYAGRLDEAAQLIATATKLGADMKRSRRKLRKARLLALVGKRLQHPKFDNPDDVRG